MKILIGEDDKFLVNAYRVKFTKLGHEVVIALDGEEVIKALETFDPDVILLDLIMPNKDGFDTLKELKTSEKYKNIPVVVTSNLGQKEDIKKAKELGADDYIVKSDMELDELVKKVTVYQQKE